MAKKKFDYNYNKLRGKIRETLGTEYQLAESIGRSNKYLSDVFNGKAYFTSNDISSICHLLKIDLEELPFYFFVEKVHETTTR